MAEASWQQHIVTAQEHNDKLHLVYVHIVLSFDLHPPSQNLNSYLGDMPAEPEKESAISSAFPKLHGWQQPKQAVFIIGG